MFYKVVLNGSYSGQDIRNILFYRTGIGFDISGLSFGGSEALGAKLMDTVVPKYLGALPTAYTLDTLDIYPMNDTYQLVYQNPLIVPVAQAGVVGPPIGGTASCVIVKFNLEATTIENGIKPPKRGYIALGPIAEAWLGEDGKVPGVSFANPAWEINQLAGVLGDDLVSLLPPVSFYPIRMKSKRNLIDILTPYESYADVSSAQARQIVSWRRSRMPES